MKYLFDQRKSAGELGGLSLDGDLISSKVIESSDLNAEQKVKSISTKKFYQNFRNCGRHIWWVKEEQVAARRFDVI